jgi:SAM-dependent methyltransferase
LGISDRHHFGWLTGALASFESETGRFSAIGRENRTPVLWGLAARRRDPALDWIANAMGGERTRVTLFDRFPEGAAGVRVQDINALDDLPADTCDVLALFRASYFVARPAALLAEARRIVRPGGLVIVDWLHGLSDAPVLDLRGDPRYGGGPTPFTTTYLDAQLLAEFPGEFEAFLRHVNRPPSWANVERPGAPVPLGERARRLLGRGPRRAVTLSTYLPTCRAELARAGKHLIEPSLLEQHFKVVFRHARYFYPHVRKFNLYLLTVLEPVGK